MSASPKRVAEQDSKEVVEFVSEEEFWTPITDDYVQKIADMNQDEVWSYFLRLCGWSYFGIVGGLT